MLSFDSLCDSNMIAVALALNISENRVPYSDAIKFNNFLSSIAKERVRLCLHASGINISSSLQVPYILLDAEKITKIKHILQNGTPSYICTQYSDSREYLIEYDLSLNGTKECIGTKRLLCALFVAMRMSTGELQDTHQHLFDLLINFAVNDRKVPYADLVASLQSHGYGV